MKDVLIQSATVAEGSIEKAMNGKSYNIGVRQYKIFYEALVRLMIPEVLQGVEDSCIEGFTERLQLMGEFTNETYIEIKNDNKFISVYRGFLDLKSQWEENGTDLQKFWLSYIDMVDILLNKLYPVRSGNWYLLLSCINDIIPFAFAYDNINYARYLTTMPADMSTLSDDFPEIYQEFVAGNFATQLSKVGKFSRCETDKVIEMTLNRDTKTPCETTGFSTNTNAVRRWEINALYRASLRSVFHQHL